MGSKRYLLLFARGFLVVSLVAVNTYQLAHEHFLGAFIVGFLISLTWWFNAGTSGRSVDRNDGFFYALGAATGTVTGLFLVTRFYR